MHPNPSNTSLYFLKKLVVLLSCAFCSCTALIRLIKFSLIDVGSPSMPGTSRSNTSNSMLHCLPLCWHGMVALPQVASL